MGVRDWWQAQQVPVGEGAGMESYYDQERLKKVLPQFHAYNSLLVPEWARYNEEAFVRYAYRSNSLVREAVEYRARSVSLATVFAYRVASKEGKEKLSDGHWIQRLLRRPSSLYPTQTRWFEADRAPDVDNG